MIPYWQIVSQAACLLALMQAAPPKEGWFAFKVRCWLLGGDSWKCRWQDVCIHAGCLYTCGMSVYLQEVCILAGCLAEFLDP